MVKDGKLSRQQTAPPTASFPAEVSNAGCEPKRKVVLRVKGTFMERLPGFIFDVREHSSYANYVWIFIGFSILSTDTRCGGRLTHTLESSGNCARTPYQGFTESGLPEETACCFLNTDLAPKDSVKSH
eukprot:s3576_g2.t1